MLDCKSARWLLFPIAPAPDGYGTTMYPMTSFGFIGGGTTLLDTLDAAVWKLFVPWLWWPTGGAGTATGCVIDANGNGIGRSAPMDWFTVTIKNSKTIRLQLILWRFRLRRWPRSWPVVGIDGCNMVMVWFTLVGHRLERAVDTRRIVDTMRLLLM